MKPFIPLLLSASALATPVIASEILGYGGIEPDTPISGQEVCFRSATTVFRRFSCLRSGKSIISKGCHFGILAGVLMVDALTIAQTPNISASLAGQSVGTNSITETLRFLNPTAAEAQNVTIVAVGYCDGEAVCALAPGQESYRTTSTLDDSASGDADCRALAKQILTISGLGVA